MMSAYILSNLRERCIEKKIHIFYFPQSLQSFIKYIIIIDKKKLIRTIKKNVPLKDSLDIINRQKDASHYKCRVLDVSA